MSNGKSMKIYVCQVCDQLFESEKNQGKIEEEWSNPALCPLCNSDEVKEASDQEIERYRKGYTTAYYW